MDNQLQLTQSANISIKVLEELKPLDTVTEYLLEQMKKVQENPANIPQANAIVAIAGRLIDVAKVKVQAGGLILKSLN